MPCLAAFANRNLFFAPSLQALLHPYFFTPPLPAHHSELPIPQRGGKKARPQHQRDFHVEQPLEEALVDLELVAPYVIDD